MIKDSFNKSEKEFYYTNFLTLFNKNQSPEEIEALSIKAAKYRKISQEHFDVRTDHLLSLSQVGYSEKAFQPYFKGWNVEKINQLKNEYGGVLISLFHYGAHRHVLMDLACLGVEISAPIARKAYWKQYELRERGPSNFGQCMELLEVEGDNVGKELFLSLRAGRIGLIYVDGNMGPETNQKQENELLVDFFDKTIKVKAGIARLAQAFNYPILPLFIVGSDENARIEFDSPILPRDKKSQSKETWQLQTMQSLYTKLEKRVAEDPSQWEYAMCLHRWLAGANANKTEDKDTETRKANLPLELHHHVKINRRNVSVLKRQESVFWVDVNAEAVIPSPKVKPELFELLDNNSGFPVGELLANSETNETVFAILQQLHQRNLIEVSSLV